MGFSASLEEGNIGEFVVWNLLSKLNTVKNVIDVRDDKYFQSVDVDFLVEDTDRQFTWLEVKTDFKAHETGNFVYESTTSGNIGCFEKTKASFIAYYVAESGNVYILSVKALRNYVESHELRTISMGDNATGYLLDIGELDRTKVIKQMYKAERIKRE